jgi:hypothetical protein
VTCVGEATKRNSRPCSVDADDPTLEQLVRVRGGIGDVPIVVDDSGLGQGRASDEGCNGREFVGSHLESSS